MPGSIYFLFIARMIDNAGSCVMPLMTLILTQKIGFTQAESGIFAAVAMLLQAPFLLLGGRLADTLGCKRVIVLFVSAGAMIYLPCALIKPHFLMAVLIVMASSCFSIAAPALNAIVPDIVSGRGMKSAYSFLFLGTNIGGAIGPVLGGMLLNRHLSLLFLLDGLSGLAAAALTYFMVKDNAKTVAQGAASGAEWESIPDLRAAARFLLHTPVLLVFALGMLVYNFSFAQWQFMLPLQMVSVFGKDAGAQLYGLLFAVNAVSIIALTPVLTTLTHRFSSVRMIAVGGTFYFLAFFLFVFGTNFAHFAFAVVVMTVGQVLTNTNTGLFAAEAAPRPMIGQINSVLSLASGAGFAISPVIIGHVLLVLPYRATWMIVAALMLMAGTAMYLLSSYERRAAGQNRKKAA